MHVPLLLWGLVCHLEEGALLWVAACGWIWSWLARMWLARSTIQTNALLCQDGLTYQHIAGLGRIV